MIAFVFIVYNLLDCLVDDAESVEFIGMGISHLAADPDNLSKTGRILKSFELVLILKMFLKFLL
jgi:hypothetical protein